MKERPRICLGTGVSRCHYVYFGLTRFGETNLVKIGHTCNLDLRLKTISSNIKRPIKTLAFISFLQEEDARRAERILHQVFYKYRLNKKGEWFAFPNSMVKFYKNKCFGETTAWLA